MVVNHDFDSPNIISQTYNVQGMSCNGCASSVERALALQNGVKSASVQLTDANVTVEFDNSIVTPDALRKAVFTAGFELELPA
ncbi:MAG: heavy-metal-associated domain-containing protein [Candidatus Kapabacteria bacterium]|nr:heavy-metal-associated domain-containing protein [Candidatus Kapabacteria bacterium]